MIHGNVAYQVNRLLKEVKEFNKSKYESKQAFKAVAKDLKISVTMQNFAERSGIHSAATADAYRIIWKECFAYAKDTFHIKSIEQIDRNIAQRFIESKMTETQNINSLAKINSAMVKLGVALDRYHHVDLNDKERLQVNKLVREGQLDKVNNMQLSATDQMHIAVREALDNYKDSDKPLHRPAQSRAYEDNKAIEANLKNEMHKIACKLIEELGMRINELANIKLYQLNSENKLTYISKGGQTNNRQITSELANSLREQFEKNGSFSLNKNSFRADVKQAAEATGQKYTGVHGLRWSAAQNELFRQLSMGKSRDEARSIVSEFLTHHRVEITEHYLRS
jgi:integrase